MHFRVALSAGLLLSGLWCAPAAAQRINIPPATLTPSAPPASFAPTLTAPPANATLGAPSFDPYAIAPATTSAPAYSPPVVPQYGTNPFGAPPAITPQYGQPPLYSQPPVYNQPVAPAFGQPYGTTYGQAAPPATGGTWSDDIGRPDPYQSGEPLRLLQNIRLRHTWVSRLEEEAGLGINDSELATTAAFPRFLFTTQPLYISPGFIFHQWDGPAGISADLPPRAYSGYVDFDYISNPSYRLGADLHVRTGLYSDFEAFNSRSFRVSGRGLGTYRLTPALQLKAGVEYINRNDLKLLPAGGVLWTPNPQVRFDIYFPKPKLAMYVTTIGYTEIWAYLAGEYGGGAWTIERAAGGDERIDINDIRAIVGTEWQMRNSLKGFVEGGFVFNREVVYVAEPLDSFDPGETFMLRGGIAY